MEQYTDDIARVAEKNGMTTWELLDLLRKDPSKLNLAEAGLVDDVFRRLDKVNYGILEGAGESWYKPDGSINYPPNNGKIPGTEMTVELQPGQSLGRYGDIRPTSNFVTEAGASSGKLSLPPNTDPSIYTQIKVIKPIPGVTQSTVAPWAGSPGMGLQYELPMPIETVRQLGYISY